MEHQKIYALRPHHGMCLAYFEGKGYSEGFTRHMGNMLKLLEKDTSVRLRVSGDEICRACPNLKNSICSTERLVKVYDQEVLKMCGIPENTLMRFGDFVSAVEEKILKPGKRPTICGNCQWNEICSSRKSRWEE